MLSCRGRLAPASKENSFVAIRSVVFTIPLALGALGSTVAPAQVEEPPVSSCCKDAVPAVLEPLGPDATDKERALRHYHEAAAENPSNVFLSTRFIDDMKARLAEQTNDTPFEQRYAVRFALCQWLQRTGDLEQAIALGEECVELVDGHLDVARAWLPETLFRLAAANFRIAERKNCVARHNADSCIFPLAGGAIHVDKQGATAARSVLERLLALGPTDHELDARWLLNIAYMAIGTWPASVPEKYRIPTKNFAPEAILPRFYDRARELGINHHNHAGSAILDDFDGDGLMDVVFVSFDTDRSLQLYRNDGDGTFTPVARYAGIDRQLGGINAVQADVDNDGRLDLLVLRGAGFFSGDEVPNSLLRQYAPGQFEDVTKAAGIEIAAPARTATFGDIDLDGDLDLFIGYESERNEGTTRHPSKLFRNDGKGRFDDVTAPSSIENPERCMGASFGDVDLDGDPDLYVSNWLAPNRLYMNGCTSNLIAFSEEAEARGVLGPDSSGPIAMFDSDDDGDLDLFVSYNHHEEPIHHVAQYYIEGTIEGDTQRLFVNDGRGHFTDETDARGLRRVAYATGLNVGDLDDDGYPDLYIATGAHDLAALFPNVLLLGGEKFRDATFAAGMGHLQKGNGIAMGDLDGDLDLDVLLQVGGFYQDDAFGDVLFENPGNKNHKLEIELVGHRDNRFGVGARIRAHLKTPHGDRDVYTFVSPGGSLGCNPLTAHLGLSDATSIEYVEVLWPAARTTQRIANPPLDEKIRIEQSRSGFEVVARRNFALTR